MAVRYGVQTTFLVHSESSIHLHVVSPHVGRFPPQLNVWDRAPTVKPDSAIYCVVIGQYHPVISRHDIDRNETKEYDLIMDSIIPRAVLCTATGHVLFLGTGSRRTINTVYSLDPSTSDVQRLDFIPEAPIAERWVLNDSTRTLICTSDDKLITFTLPPQYFLLPKCCDRDL